MTPKRAAAAPRDHCATSIYGTFPLYNNGLSTYLSRYGEASLCADIQPFLGSYSVTDTSTIDLNNHIFTGTLNAYNVTVTLLGTENGVVNGDLTTTGRNGKFVIYGGTYTVDPSNFVAPGYAAKKVGSRWTVVKQATVTAEDVTIPVGGAAKLYEVTPAGDATVVLRDASGADVTATAGRISIQTAGDVTTGTITGVAPGEYTATITTDTNTATANVTVYNYTAPNDMVLFRGSSEAINLTTTGADVDWSFESSSDATVATVENGRVKALSSGVTTITLKLADSLGTTVSFRVTVYDFDVTDDAPILIRKGETATIPTDSHWNVTASQGDEIASIAAGENGAYTISAESTGQTNFTFTAAVADGTTLTKTVKVYVYDVTKDEIWVKKGETVNYDGIELGSDEMNVVASSDDASIASIAEGGAYGITGVNAGDAVITYIISVDNESVSVPVKAHVYNVNAKSTATIVSGTEVEFTNPAIAEIENPSSIRVEVTRGTDYITADETADGKFTTVSKGTAVIRYYAGEIEAGSTEIRVYEKQNLGDVLLRMDTPLGKTHIIEQLNDTNLPDYTITSGDNTVATIRRMLIGGGYRLTAAGAGSTIATVTYRDSLGETTETFNIIVSDYNTRNVSDNHDVAQGGQVKFTISERYDEESVTYADDLGFNIEKDANGNYTVNVPADMASGEYTLHFTDKINGTTIATQDVTIRVHEITASADEIYMKKGETQTVTAKEAHGFGELCRTEWHWFIIPYATLECDVEVRDAEGSTTDELTVTGHETSDDFTIEAKKAGSYTVTFTDGVATKTINVYVIDFTVEDAEYHVAKGDTAPKLVKALNDYWNETAKGDTTGFVITKDNDTDYYFWPTDAEAGKYELTFSALANGQVVDEKSTTVYLYEMIAPTETEYYGEAGNDIFDIVVDDKLNAIVPDMAQISYEVIEGDADKVNVDLENGQVEISGEGKYVVEFTDRMANGGIVDTYTATFYMTERDYGFVMVPAGETVELTSKSVWSVDSGYDTVSGKTVEAEDSKVAIDTTGMELGTHHVVLLHDFGRGGIRPLKDVLLVVYKVSASEDSEELNPGEVTTATMKHIFQDTSEATSDLIRRLMDDEVPVAEIAEIVLKMYLGILTDEEIEALGYPELFADYKAKFGENEWGATVADLNLATGYGEEILVDVRVEETDPEDDVKSAFEAILPDADVIKYYDVSVLLTADGDVIGQLHELDDTITVAIAETTDPATGYTRKYMVARMHNGEVELLTEGKDFYIKDGIIYVVSDRFSTYAVAYEDTLIPVTVSAPETGANTATEGGATSNNVAMLMTAVLATITLFAAAIFAKRK
ncbi:hypothetical protein IKE72_01380 [Candidatus Saccharibacteria bacterium]|nr:hypothetical protein [Candidatus Saccharibacteria bacterium]